MSPRNLRTFWFPGFVTADITEEGSMEVDEGSIESAHKGVHESWDHHRVVKAARIEQQCEISQQVDVFRGLLVRLLSAS